MDSASQHHLYQILLRRALKDQQIVRTPEQLKEWFSDFVDLHEDEVQTEIDAVSAEVAAASPISHAVPGGRRKSTVFTMLQEQGAVDATPAKRRSRGNSLGGSLAKRMMMNSRSASVADGGDQSVTPFANFAARRKSRVVDLGAMRSARSDQTSPPRASSSGRSRSHSPVTSAPTVASAQPSRGGSPRKIDMAPLDARALSTSANHNDNGSPTRSQRRGEPADTDTEKPSSPLSPILRDAGSVRKKKKSGIRFTGEDPPLEPRAQGSSAADDAPESSRVGVPGASEDVEPPAEPASAEPMALDRFTFNVEAAVETEEPRSSRGTAATAREGALSSELLSPAQPQRLPPRHGIQYVNSGFAASPVTHAHSTSFFNFGDDEETPATGQPAIAEDAASPAVSSPAPPGEVPGGVDAHHHDAVEAAGAAEAGDAAEAADAAEVLSPSEAPETRKNRLVSFGAFSVTSDHDPDDPKSPMQPPKSQGESSALNSMRGTSSTMGVRLLQKLQSKQSLRKVLSPPGPKVVASGANAGKTLLSPNTFGASAASDEGSSNAGGSPTVAMPRAASGRDFRNAPEWSHRDSVAIAPSEHSGRGNDECDAPLDAPRPRPSEPAYPATECKTIAELEQRLDDGLSALELRDVLLQDRYFTNDQMRLRRFQRRTQFAGYCLADFSIALVFFTAFTVAARVGLGSDRISPHLVWAELALDVLNFVLVLGVNLLLPFEDQGQIRTDLATIVKRYLSHPQLAVFDFVSTFPVVVIAAAAGRPQAEWARLNLLLRELKLSQLFEKLEEQLPATLHPSAMRLLSYFLYLVLIVTHLSMGLMFAVRMESEGETMAWMGLSKEDRFHSDTWYWFSRFWLGGLELITNKDMPYPRTDTQILIALCGVIIGVVTLAVILASFEEIIVTEIEEGNVLSKKVDDAIEVMDALEVPAELQHEIMDYYKAMWDINRSFDFNADDLLAELPDLLHDDIEFECNARVIRSIPLFAEVAQNKAFVRLLAGELRQLVVMPGAPIVVRGEVGDCMFFISAGLCSVLSPETETEEAVLGAGSFFGEVTLLFGGERDRTIKAKTLCVCYVVTDAQFEGVVEDYPEALDDILRSAVRQIKDSQQAVAADDAALRELLQGEDSMFQASPPENDHSSVRAAASPERKPSASLPRDADADDVMSEGEIAAMMASRLKFRHSRSVFAPLQPGFPDAENADGSPRDEEEETRRSPSVGGTNHTIVSPSRTRQHSEPSPAAAATNPLAGLSEADAEGSFSPPRGGSLGSARFEDGGLNFVVQRNRRASVGFSLREGFQS